MNEGFSAGAHRTLAKNLTASFNQTFGTDHRQTVGLEDHLGDAASFQLTVCNAGNQLPRITGVGSPLAPVGPTDFSLQALAPPPGLAGFVVMYQHKVFARARKSTVPVTPRH